jgi:hypothetical protein
MKEALVLGLIGLAMVFAGCDEEQAKVSPGTDSGLSSDTKGRGGSGGGAGGTSGEMGTGGAGGAEIGTGGAGGAEIGTGGAGGAEIGSGGAGGADGAADARPGDAGSDATTPTEVRTNETGSSSCDPASLISASYLTTKLSELSGASPVTIDGQSQTIKERYTAASKQVARAYLRQEYQALGFTVSEHKYSTGTNLIAQKKGVEDRIVMFSAHYDSASASIPGADDDGTGIIGGLAIARALAGCTLDRELRLLAFDEEEAGMKGSTAYVSQMTSNGDSAKLDGNIVMEMYGYDKNNDGGFIVIDCSTIPGTTALVDALRGAITTGNLSLVMKNGPACESGSDHDPFWAKKLPAIVFSEEFFINNADTTPCYHQSCDRVDQINFDYMAKLTRMAALAAVKLAGAH